MITSTGLGDGYYPVFAERLKSENKVLDGRIASILIPFI